MTLIPTTMLTQNLMWTRWKRNLLFGIAYHYSVENFLRVCQIQQHIQFLFCICDSVVTIFKKLLLVEDFFQMLALN